MSKIKENLLLRSFFSGSALTLLAMGFAQGSTVIQNVLLARILGIQAFGQYSIVYTTLLTMATLIQSSGRNAAAKYVSEYSIHSPRLAGAIIKYSNRIVAIASLGAVLGIVLSSEWLSKNLLHQPVLAKAIIIGSVFIFFFSLNGTQLGALSGLEGYDTLAAAGLISGFLSVATVVLFSQAYGRNGAIFGMSLGAFLRWMIHRGCLLKEIHRKGIKTEEKISKNELRPITGNYLLPAAISGWFSWLMLWLSTTLLLRGSSGSEDMGVYSAAASIKTIALFLPTVTNIVGTSEINKRVSFGFEKTNVAFKVNFLTSIATALVSVSVFAGLNTIILSFFGREYVVGQTASVFLLLSVVFDSISMALFQYIQMMSKIWLGLFAIVVPRDLFLFIAACVLVPRYSYNGLALSYLAASMLGVVLHFTCYRSLRNRKLNEKAL